MNRREFTFLGAMALGANAAAPGGTLAKTSAFERYETPYKLETLVLAASGDKGCYDNLSVDCPFVFWHQDRFYMTFIGFDGVGYQTGLAQSSDLIHWEKLGPILRRDPSSKWLQYSLALHWILRESELYSAGKLVPIHSQFVGVYQVYPAEGLEQGAGRIGLARSRDLHSWKLDPPFLSPEDGAAWERGGLYKPCLLRYAGTYYLFYNAKNQTTGPWHEQTGVATSKDLQQWTRYSGNPILRNGGPGSLDERFASDPCVLRDEGQWVIFYFGLDRKGVARDLVATGSDWNHLTKDAEPLINVGAAGSVDSVYAHKPSLIAYRGDLYHFYCAVSKANGQEVRGISVARSRPWNT